MSEHDSKGAGRAPWHLWAVGIFALLWSGIGAMDYVMTQTRNAAYLGQFTREQLDFFYGIPAWAIATWAIAVWGGVVGAVLLLLKRRLAVWVFGASLAGMVITTIQNYGLSNGMEIMGDPFSLGFNALIFLLSVGFFVYARGMHRSGVLA